MDLETIIETCYKDTLPNKRRSSDSVLFETHIERNLVKLCDDINNHTLQPSAYSFIVMKPKPREVFAGDVSLRICQHYIQKNILPHLEERLIPFTFSNRKGMGSQAAVNNVISDIYKVSRGFTSDNCWIIKLDMQGYFPNASQDIAYRQFEKLALECDTPYKDDLLYMLQVSAFSYPTLHGVRRSNLSEWKFIDPAKSLYNKPLGQGAVIGHLFWQLAMIFYINDIEVWLVYECRQYITVYMDDITIITANKEVTLSLIPELRRRLAAISVTLHPKKFYCQHYKKGVEFVGYHIKMDRVYINNRCRRNALRRIKTFNRHISERNIDSFVSTVNSYLGRYKTVNGYTLVCELLKKINPAWWTYIEYDKERICVHPRKDYTYRQRIINRYNLQDYEKRRNRKRNQQGKPENP